MSETVVQNVTLFDGKTTHSGATVTFSSSTGLITGVSTDNSSAELPPGATVIDGKGHTLLPGLIDAHIHCYGLHLPDGADLSSVLKDPLRCGVTTVCDMHSDTETVWDHQKRVKEELDKAKQDGKSGRVTMASLKSAHLGATIEGGWPKPIVLAGHATDELIAKVNKWPKLTPESAYDFVAGHKKDGADYIKLMQENCCSLAFPTNSIPVATLELQTAVVKAAHQHGMPVVGHATAVESTEIILKSGADGLAHTFVDQAPTDEIIALYKKTGAFVVPTLTVLTSLTGEEQEWRDRFAGLAKSKGLITQAQHDTMCEILGAKAESATINHAYASVRQLKAAGIDVVAGTDAIAGLKGTAIGPSLWQEMAMYVDKCGFTPEEALRSATEVGARRFKFSDRGTVEVGKRADLVLVAGNVTQKLDHLWEGEGVMRVWKEGLLAA